jgi:phage replication O-like protein O
VADPYIFRGFDSPNYTQVPDILFDELMAHLSGAELKVLLYIIRRTFGFKKGHDAISINQIVSGITTKGGKVLDIGTGLSKDSVARALKGLEEKRVIIRERRISADRGFEPTTFRLNMYTPLSENQTRDGGKIGQGLVRKSDTQETA